MRLLVLVFYSILLAGCATSESFGNSFEYGDRTTTSVVLSAPNISSPHNPPLFVGVAYLEVYDKAAFCEKVPGLMGEKYQIGKPIGKMFAHKSQRQRQGKIPVGQVVFRAGLETQSFGSSECDGYFSFDAKAYRTYEVEVKESRPLITHCYVSVKEKDLSGAFTEISSFSSSEERIFLGDDVSGVCDESSNDEDSDS